MMQGLVELGAQQPDDGLLPLYPWLLPWLAESEHRSNPAGSAGATTYDEPGRDANENWR